MLQFRRCAKCKLDKFTSEFYPVSHKPHLLRSYCKQCCIDAMRAYREQPRPNIKLKHKLNHIDRLNDSLDHIADVVDLLLTKKQKYLKQLTKEHI